MPRAPLLLALLALVACKDLDRFDSSDGGAYCGDIVSSDFTRKGFDTLPHLRLTLDIDQLTTAPGTLSSDDAATGPCAPEPQFADAPLVVTTELFADPLSLLEFGASREHNFIAWVDSTCRGRALAVVSLMHDGSVEVRLLRPGAVTEPDSTEFGVFQLQRETCTF